MKKDYKKMVQDVFICDLKMSVHRYLDRNNLFTGGSWGNYEKMEELLKAEKIHDVAVIIWAVSTTTKTIEEIENDLTSDYNQLKEESNEYYRMLTGGEND